jgi:hypothetical protein
MIDQPTSFPRVRLGFYPTPITNARAPLELVGGPRISSNKKLQWTRNGRQQSQKAWKFILGEAKNREPPGDQDRQRTVQLLLQTAAS